MAPDDFHNVSVVYGLDSQIFANYFKAFASYLDIPKKEWNKYHAPYKDTVNCVPASSIEIHTVDPIVPEPYIEKTVSRQYLALDEIYRPIGAAFPNNPTRRQRQIGRASCRERVYVLV